MSDPVTNVELEDVLSSIRRLVADRDAPLPRASERRISAERFFATGFAPLHADYFAGVHAPQAT